jgi:hypothetical protein
VVTFSVVNVVDVDGTNVVPNLCVQVRVDTAVQEVVGTVTVTNQVVSVGTVLVLVSVYDVTVILVVMFERMNVKTTCTEVVPVGTHAVVTVVTVVVTGPCIGVIAGAIPGTSTPSPARVTQTMTRALIASCLLKSVPSRCWACCII